MATKIIRPILDQYTNGWVNSDSTTENLYSYIDETVASDSDYISADTISYHLPLIIFKFESAELPEDTPINKITLYCRGKQSRAKHGAETTMAIYINSTVYDYEEMYTIVPPQYYGTNYETRIFESTINPHTSSGWTASDINNLFAGICFWNEDTNTFYVSQMYIEIDYTPNTPKSENYSAKYSLILGE